MAVRRVAAMLVPVLLWSLAAPLPARANDDEEAARALAATAVTLAKQERYQEALDLFTKAYAIDPDPVLLFNIAYLHEKMGKLYEAFEAWERYLAVETAEGPRKDAAARIEALRPRTPGRLVLEGGPAGARILVDGRAAGTVPSPALDLAAGDHVVRLTADGHDPQGRTVTLEPGRTTSVRIELARTAPPLEPPVEAPAVAGDDSDSDTLTWVLVGVGAAALIGGGIAAGILLQPDDPAAPPTPDKTWTLPAGGP